MPSSARVTLSIFQKHLMGSPSLELLCCLGSGVGDPTPGCLVGQWVQTLPHSWLLGASPLSMPAAAMCGRAGGAGRQRTGSPRGLISSLLTNPVTREQTEQDGARHKASQHRSGPMTTVSLLGRTSIEVAAWTPQGAHLPRRWVGSELHPSRESPSTPRLPTAPPHRAHLQSWRRCRWHLCLHVFTRFSFSASTPVTMLKPQFLCGCPSGVWGLWHRSCSSA